ncbi:phage holin family protein [Clostridium weizhouense]|uniref:Uncharacterized protein n=1 Tax=Clostridium weizhouense TaxID=2859781 RepID=A0ABS7AT62_9CLOT|nr:phage holin family protein [Clostridium weizhouense]MBW6411860.1 hypothetical protein [Clostridium weizhouense]
MKISIISAGKLSIKANNINLSAPSGLSLNYYPSSEGDKAGNPKGITLDPTNVSFKVEEAYFEGKIKESYPFEQEPIPSFSSSPTKVEEQQIETAPNEDRIEKGKKTFWKGVGIACLAVGMVAVTLLTGGLALGVGAVLIEGAGVATTLLGVGVIGGAVLGTATGLSAANKEAEIASATIDEGKNEKNNGEKGVDEKGYNEIRDGEFNGDEKAYEQYKDEVWGMWCSAVMINMTAASMGCELAPFAMAVDTMLSPKVNFGVVNNNLIFGYNGKNSSYFGGIGKDFGGNLGKIALNNNGKGFLYQSNNNKFGIIGLARENAVPYKPGIVATTSRNTLPI